MRGLTNEEVETFRANGVVCLRGALDEGQVAALTQAIDALVPNVGHTPTGYDLERLGDEAYSQVERVDVGMAKQYDADLMSGFLRYEGDRRITDEVEAGAPKGRFLLDSGNWTRNEAIRDLALDSHLPSLAARLMASRTVAFYDDQMFVKTPGTRQRTAFHQDYPFFNLEGFMGCVFWMPVDAVDERNGALSYVRGSHLWEADYASSMFVSHTPMPGSTGERVPDVEADPDAFDLVRFETEPGDVIVHHFRTLHGAGGNRTADRTRRVMSMRYVGEDMRYKWKAGAPRPPYHSYQKADGDEVPCRDFPLVWPRPFEGARLSTLYEGGADTALERAA
jgi:ectoine hydroxylase-related dioxygenase (phytanoyl-CoA dioxygenase family)